MRTFYRHVSMDEAEEELSHCTTATTNIDAISIASEGFGEFLAWIYKPVKVGEIDHWRIMTRSIAAALTIRPDLVAGLNMSQIQRLTRGRISQPWLSKTCKEFQKEFGFKSSCGKQRK